MSATTRVTRRPRPTPPGLSRQTPTRLSTSLVCLGFWPRVSLSLCVGVGTRICVAVMPLLCGYRRVGDVCVGNVVTSPAPPARRNEDLGRCRKFHSARELTTD